MPSSPQLAPTSSPTPIVLTTSTSPRGYIAVIEGIAYRGVVYDYDKDKLVYTPNTIIQKETWVASNDWAFSDHPGDAVVFGRALEAVRRVNSINYQHFFKPEFSLTPRINPIGKEYKGYGDRCPKVHFEVVPGTLPQICAIQEIVAVPLPPSKGLKKTP